MKSLDAISSSQTVVLRLAMSIEPLNQLQMHVISHSDIMKPNSLQPF